MFSQLFHKFIDEGKRPSTTQEITALLDEARSTILNITQRIESGDLKVACPIDATAREYQKIRANVFGDRAQAVAAAPASTALAQKAREQFTPIRNGSGKAAQAAAKPVAAKPASTAKAPQAAASNRYAGADERLVAQAATHRSSPEADRVEARKELEARGFSVTPCGIISHSIRGGRAVRLAQKAK